MKELDRLVKEFADNVASQAEAIGRADSTLGNRHARKYLFAFNMLRAYGDEGRNALAGLFTDPRPEVRVTAAGFLLRHCTGEALKVLKSEIGKPGFTSFEAEQVIEKWNDGTWALDPEDCTT